jgi:hypothetical protein
MALFTESTVRQRAALEIRKSYNLKNANQIIVESSASFTFSKKYDIFLSHSIRDAELILGMKGIFEDLGYSVYVDWIDDPQLDRSKVSASTARKLKDRMNAAKSLFYVTTSNSESSKWMPWECGYFDGKREKVAIVPIQTMSVNNIYFGQEYLGLYPYVVKERSNGGSDLLYIRTSYLTYIDYDTWVSKENSLINWRDG